MDHRPSPEPAHRLKHTAIVIAVVLACLAEFVIFAAPSKHNQRFISYAAGNCTVSAILVNPCRPWVGTATTGYAMAPNTDAVSAVSQFDFATKRLNNSNVLSNPSAATTITNTLDIFHDYNAAGSSALSAADIKLAQRGTIVYANWKPAADWVSASGGNSAVNTSIAQMAQSIKSLGTTKIMLALYHEPENDVSSGNCTTNAGGAAAGSPTDYVNMWHNVRSIFDAQGVTNVVWVMNYMGYSNWDCLVPLLWPGNSYVDWVTWDNYGKGTTLFTASVQHFYNLLSTDTDASHAFTSKPWGLGEFGYGNSGSSTQANTSAYWVDAKSAITNNTFPLLKLYDVFDTTGNSGTSCVGMLFCTSTINIAAQTAYNDWANTIFAEQPASPPPDTTPPSVSITSPASSSTVSGTETFAVSASDDTAVMRVRLVWDSSNVIRDATSQGAFGWGGQWDTTSASNGSHSVTATAYDAAGNSSSSTINLTINNNVTAPAPVISSFTATPASVTVGQTSTLAWTTSNTTSCSVNPGGPQNSTATNWTSLAYTTSGTSQYTLVCKNSDGVTTSSTASVTVNPAVTAPTAVTLSASATTVQTGSTVLLSWTSNGSTSCLLNPGNYTASGGSSSKSIADLTTTTTYTVTCSNTAGNSNSNALKITVQATAPPPADPVIISLIATPTNVASGGSSTLSWQTSNVVSGGCTLVPSILKSTNGNASWTTPALNASESYTLTCKNSLDAAVSKSVSVTVANAPAPPAPAAATPTDIKPTTTGGGSIVTATTGQRVVNLQATSSITIGDLATLDPANVTDAAIIKNITKVEYYENGSLVQTVDGAPFALNSAKLKAGSYNVTQRTYYVDGSTSQQSQLVTINAKAVAKITAVSPGGGSLWLGLSVGILIAAYVAALRWRLRHSTLAKVVQFTEPPTVIKPTK